MNTSATLPRRPATLGRYGARERQQSAEERLMRVRQQEWAAAVASGAPPEEINRLATLFVQAKRECQ